MRRRAVARARRRSQNARPAFGVQAKLRVGRSDDPLELEADRISDALVSTTRVGDGERGLPGPLSPSLQPRPLQPRSQGQDLQAKGAAGVAAGGVAPSVEAAIANQTGQGVPLGRRTRQLFENRFGTQLGRIQTHTDPTANRLAHSLRARAFTVGEHIFFASGQYDQRSHQGRRLLVHELTHTVQQRGRTAADRTLQRDDDAPAETAPTTITFSWTGTLQTPPCGSRTLRASTDGNPVTWSLEPDTAQVDSGSSIDPNNGTITIGASQGAGVIQVVATVPSGAALAADLPIGAHPTGITSTRLEANPPAGNYGHVLEHLFESSDGDVTHLEGVPVGEKFPDLANPNGASHRIRNPPYPFDTSFTLTTATLTSDASNNWFLTSAGELGGSHDTIDIAHGNIDVGRFVQSASNPRPAGRLPAGFTVEQHLHWYCPQEANTRRRWTDFVTVAHSRTLQNNSGSLSMVTTVNGVEDGGDDYVGPSAVTNLNASPVSTPRSAGPPSGRGTAPTARTVALSVDSLPSPLPSTETLAWSIVGNALGCSITPDTTDSTQATLTIGTTAGSVTIQVADATAGNFDRVTVRIT